MKIDKNLLFGILNINKPKGFTSHDVVAKLRKILNIKQVGHTGTLDPIATGVLPICVGKATKLIQYLETAKAYRVYIKLGIRTDTYDFDGEILEAHPVKLDADLIKDKLQTFLGTITQKPPMYSAVHYKGKRLYEYARKNIEIDNIPEREVTVNSINLVEIQDEASENPIATVDIDCSGGTYIRSIVHDLGNLLGYGATMAGLIRTRSGKFRLEESYTIDQIEDYVSRGRLQEILINPKEILDLKRYSVDDKKLEKIKQGQYIKIQYFEEDLSILDEGEKIQLIHCGELISIAQQKERKIFPVNVFK